MSPAVPALDSRCFDDRHSGMEFCDRGCKYGRFPDSDSVYDARSCRTPVALYSGLKKGLVHKNLPCGKKKAAKRIIGRRA